MSSCILSLMSATAMWHVFGHLGLRVKFESPGWSEFVTGGSTLALHPASDKNPAGKIELGFTVADVEAFYRDISAKGVLFTMPPKKPPAARQSLVDRGWAGRVFPAASCHPGWHTSRSLSFRRGSRESAQRASAREGRHAATSPGNLDRPASRPCLDLYEDR